MYFTCIGTAILKVWGPKSLNPYLKTPLNIKVCRNPTSSVSDFALYELIFQCRVVRSSTKEACRVGACAREANSLYL